MGMAVTYKGGQKAFQPNQESFMKTKTKATHSLAFLGIALMTNSMVGCINSVAKEDTDTSMDGQSAFISSEMDQMGSSLQGLPGAMVGKVGTSQADTITTELILERYAFHEDCGCMVRTAEFTGSVGFERTRIDSVTLLDSAGEVLQTWDRSRIAKINHKRHVIRSKGPHAIDVHFITEATFKMDASVLVGVWNGTMTGTFDGEDFKSGTITQVTREYKNHGFGFPVSGTVTVTRPKRTYTIEFLGEGDAKATITNLRTGKVTVITIDRDYKEAPTP
jgi:hypothetical protein